MLFGTNWALKSDALSPPFRGVVFAPGRFSESSFLQPTWTSRTGCPLPGRWPWSHIRTHSIASIERLEPHRAGRGGEFALVGSRRRTRVRETDLPAPFCRSGLRNHEPGRGMERKAPLLVSQHAETGWTGSKEARSPRPPQARTHSPEVPCQAYIYLPNPTPRPHPARRPPFLLGSPTKYGTPSFLTDWTNYIGQGFRKCL